MSEGDLLEFTPLNNNDKLQAANINRVIININVPSSTNTTQIKTSPGINPMFSSNHFTDEEEILSPY